MDPAGSVVKDFIAHHGVKGQKWGVRRDHVDAFAEGIALGNKHAKKVLGNAADVKKFADSRKVSDTKQAFNKKVSEAGGLHKISDKELQAMLNRLDNERKYSKIQNEDAARRAEGAKAIGRVLLEVGKVALPIVAGVVITKGAGAAAGAYRTKAYTAGPKIIEGASRALGSK